MKMTNLKINSQNRQLWRRQKNYMLGLRYVKLLLVLLSKSQRQYIFYNTFAIDIQLLFFSKNHIWKIIIDSPKFRKTETSGSEVRRISTWRVVWNFHSWSHPYPDLECRILIPIPSAYPGKCIVAFQVNVRPML